MCGRKPWIKKTAAYWFAHKAYSAFIRGWIRQCMKQFENRWLSNSEICLVTIPYMFLPFTISSCFTYFFSRFLGVSHVSPCVSPWFLFLFLLNYGVFIYFWRYTGWDTTPRLLLNRSYSKKVWFKKFLVSRFFLFKKTSINKIFSNVFR